MSPTAVTRDRAASPTGTSHGSQTGLAGREGPDKRKVGGSAPAPDTEQPRAKQVRAGAPQAARLELQPPKIGPAFALWRRQPGESARVGAHQSPDRRMSPAQVAVISKLGSQARVGKTWKNGLI